MNKNLKIYHNPRCRKSREALALIKERADIEIFDYMKQGLDINQLKEDIIKIGKKASELVRKNEAIYKESYKNKNLSEEEWLYAFVEEPRLLERPIVVTDSTGILGRPPEEVLKLF